MAAPVNDKIANAIVLPANQVGITFGTNVEATAEPGEPANNGKSVWWKWQCPASQKYRVATRHAAQADFGALPQTDFATILSVFYSPVQFPTFPQLQLLGKNARYAAAWQAQSQVEFLANAGDWIFFRVDGNITGTPAPPFFPPVETGKITLWWGPFVDLIPSVGDCPSCMQGTLHGAVCVGNWSPDVSRYQEHPFPNTALQQGNYVLLYCGGAVGLPFKTNIAPDFGTVFHQWQTIGSGDFIYGDWSSPDVPQWIPGNCIGLQFGVAGARFSDGNFVVNGFAGQSSPDSAIAVFVAKLKGLGQCAAYNIKHDGTGPIAMQFTSPNFNPNNADGITAPCILPGNGKAPTFTLIKITPLFTAKGCCGYGPFYTHAANTYILKLTFSNDSDFDWSGSGANLSAAGLTVLQGQGQAWAVDAHKLVTMDFWVQTTNKNVVATLALGDVFGLVKNLQFDLTPTLIGITVTSAGKSFIDPVNRNRLSVLWKSTNGLPFDDVQPSIALTGGVLGVFSSFDGTVDNPVDSGHETECGGSNVVPFDISTTTLKPDSVTVTISAWYDNGVLTSLPPTTITVPLLWT